jgi:hypothetical protein
MPITRPTLLRRFIGLAAVPVLLLTAAACGDDDQTGGGNGDSGASSDSGDSSSFCEAFEALDNDMSDADSADAMEDAVSRVQDLDPPEEIADEWATFVEAFEQSVDLSAEELAEAQESGDFEDAAAASERIDEYVTEECGIGE